MGVSEITFCDPKALKAKKAKKDPIMLKKLMKESEFGVNA